MKKNWNGKIQNILHNVILNLPVAEQLKKGTTGTINMSGWAHIDVCSKQSLMSSGKNSKNDLDMI